MAGRFQRFNILTKQNFLSNKKSGSTPLRYGLGAKKPILAIFDKLIMKSAWLLEERIYTILKYVKITKTVKKWPKTLRTTKQNNIIIKNHTIGMIYMIFEISC